MLYTRKGDTGTTKTFDAKPGERISKASLISEALGSLDEVNSFLGLAKVRATEAKLSSHGTSLADITHQLQKNLFIIQAELAGANKTIGEEKVRALETTIDVIEKELPPITTFFISGGSELAALFDIARTLARRAERRVVAVFDSKERHVGEHSRAYLNRLSSILYALARLSNRLSGIQEASPDYT